MTDGDDRLRRLQERKAPPGPRRRPAEASRVAVVGASVAVMLTMIAGMIRDALEPRQQVVVFESGAPSSETGPALPTEQSIVGTSDPAGPDPVVVDMVTVTPVRNPVVSTNGSR